ncbi:MAG: threonine/serine exporter family protein [Clostridia bacterium]|nr:threonine/serine exporter family protein [Clostridia bacterium]
MTVFIAAVLGSLGFGLMFGNRGIKLVFSALGGAVCWGAYLLAGLFTQEEFLRVLIASLAAALYSEIMARALKAPATVFSLIAAMPLVPGSGLYHTMKCAISGDGQGTLRYAVATLGSAAAIAVGIVCISLCFKYAALLGRALANRRKT